VIVEVVTTAMSYRHVWFSPRRRNRGRAHAFRSPSRPRPLRVSVNPPATMIASEGEAANELTGGVLHSRHLHMSKLSAKTTKANPEASKTHPGSNCDERVLGSATSS